jgi:hypothetical protein
MKYSRTVMPSRKLLRTGTSMMRPDGSAMRPRMPPSWLIWPLLPRAPESDIIRTEPKASRPSIMAVGQVVGGLLPDVDDLLVALVIGDEAALELAVDLVDGGVRLGQARPCPAG